MEMTKKMMVDYIEKSGMVLDFDRNYLMKHSKQYIEDLYNRAVVYNHQKIK